MHVLGCVRPAQEEDLAGELLADLAGQICAAVATVETSDIGISLLEAGVLATGQSQVARRVQAMPAAGRPPVYQADNDLGHEADQPLDFEDVQPAGACYVNRVGGFAGGVLVAAAAA